MPNKSLRRCNPSKRDGSRASSMRQVSCCEGHREEVFMKAVVAQWSLILLCFSMAAAIGGGFYESIVLTPLWSNSPPSSFSIIQPGTGVPLQRFWIPVHVAITLFILLALVLTWGEPTVRHLLLAPWSPISSCACGAACFSSLRCSHFSRYLWMRPHPRPCRRGSPGGHFGRGSENPWTSSPLFVLCWHCMG